VPNHQFAFVGRVSTEDNQEPEASKARQIAQATRILPPGAEVVAEYFDIGHSRSLPWQRRPATGQLLADLRSGSNTWGAIVVGEFARAFGAPIQYSTIYPLLEHFGVELWLPEVGGRVDFSSATTEMLLGMLGGTSKQERALVRTRVREGMTVLAREGNRHLGGRPPYGYRLADAGEHPNPKKRALGQRLHRLEPDPVTAPVVERIFTLFAAGHGLRSIANILTSEGAPSPAAHDRVRNPHRDPTGWAHTAIRAILRNEKYRGQAVWGKQARTDELLDLDDVAAGYVTRQRWTSQDRWIYAEQQAHEPLISDELWSAVAERISSTATQRPRGTRTPRATTTPYVLRGLLFCGICGRKMEGSVSRAILRYRCQVSQTRSLPPYLAHHPKSLYVREDEVVHVLDQWLSTLASSEALAATQQLPAESPDAAVRRRLREIDLSTQRLVHAIEAGADPEAIKPRLAELKGQKEAAERDLKHEPSEQKLTSADIEDLVERLGGLTTVLAQAPPAEKAELYRALNLRLTYQPDPAAVVATADLGGGVSRVGGPIQPVAPASFPCYATLLLRP
jgi:DNA invertase Pin-like site-specific DNA recombinase